MDSGNVEARINAAKTEARAAAFAECIDVVEMVAATTKAGVGPEVKRILDSLASRSGNDGEAFARREYTRGVQNERAECLSIAKWMRACSGTASMVVDAIEKRSER